MRVKKCKIGINTDGFEKLRETVTKVFPKAKIQRVMCTFKD